MSASIKNDRGFTLTELNISLAVLSILIVALLSTFTYFLVLVTRNNILLDMTVDSQSLLRTAVEELRFGAGVRQTNSITDPNAPVGGWNTSNSIFVIIIAVPAIDTDRNYIVDSDTGNPYLNELVYYRNGDFLYKRILADPDASGNSLRTTCPPGMASPTCSADRRLIGNVGSMDFVLYDQDDNTTDNAQLARSIVINLTLYKDSFGSPITLDNKIRITLRNTF